MQSVAAGQVSQAPPLRVAVVGAGLLGSSTAWQLAKRGYEVTVIEAAKRPAEGAAFVLHARGWKEFESTYRFRYVLCH